MKKEYEVNIIFAGTSPFAIPALKSLNEKYNIKCVVTQPDRPYGRGRKISKTAVKKSAEELNIPIFQPENINSKESVEYLKSLEPDFFITAAYGQILKKRILALPRYYPLNIHASILPKYRGAAPINWAIINGENKTGISIFIMERKMDTGPVFTVSETEIDENENAYELHDKLAQISGVQIINAIEKIVNEDLKPLPQNHEEATYAPKLEKPLFMIDWSKTSEDIHNLVRGLALKPGAETEYNDKKIKIYKTEKSKLKTSEKPGKILGLDKEKGIKAAAGDGILFLQRLQLQGKRVLDASDFWNGNILEEGSFFC